MALEITGFDIQIKTQQMQEGVSSAVKNLGRIETKADKVNKSINAIFRLRENVIVGQRTLNRLAKLEAQIVRITVALREMAAAGAAATQAMPGAVAGGAAARGAPTFGAAAARRLQAVPTSTGIGAGYMAGGAAYQQGAAAFAARPEVAAAMEKANRATMSATSALNQQVGVLGKLQGAARGVGTAMTGVGTAVRSVAMQMAAAGTKMQTSFAAVHGSVIRLRYILASLGGFLLLREVVGTLKEYEFRMSGVQAITRASRIEMEAMDARARRLGATTMRFAQEAAHGMRQFAQAGFTATEAIAAIEGALNLSIAGTVDMGVAVEITANAVRGFNLEAEEAGRVADVLAVAATRSNTTIALLGEAMRYVAPVAASVGMEIETTAAAIGILGNAGIKGSMAGASLRRVVSSLVNPTSGARKAMASLNLSTKDLNPTLRSTTEGMTRFVEIMHKLRDAGMGAKEAFAIFGLRGGPAATALVLMIDRYEALEKATFDAKGEAQRMADVMGDNLRGELLRLRSAVQENIIAWGEAGLTGTMTKHVKTLTTVFRMWAGMTSPLEQGVEGAWKLKSSIETLGRVILAVFVAKALGSMIAGLLRVGTLLAGFSLSMAGARAAFAAFTAAVAANPWGLILVTVTAATAAIVNWHLKTTQAGEEIERLNAHIEETNRLLEETAKLSDTELMAWAPKIAVSLDEAQRLVKDTQNAIAAQQKIIAGQGSFSQQLMRENPVSVYGLGIMWGLYATSKTRSQAREQLEELNRLLKIQEQNLREVENRQKRINAQKEREVQLQESIIRGQRHAEAAMRAFAMSQEVSREVEVLGATGQEQKERIEARHRYEDRLDKIENDRARILEDKLAAASATRLTTAEVMVEFKAADEALGALAGAETDALRAYQAELVEIAKNTTAYTDALSDAEEIIANIQTPQAAYAEQLARIDELTKTLNYETGQYMLSEDQAARARQKAREEYIQLADAEFQAGTNLERLIRSQKEYYEMLEAARPKTPEEWGAERLELLRKQHELIFEGALDSAEAIEHWNDVEMEHAITVEEKIQLYRKATEGIRTFDEIMEDHEDLLISIQTPQERYIENMKLLTETFERAGDAGSAAFEKLKRMEELDLIRGIQAQEMQDLEDKMTLATAGMPRFARGYVESTGLVDMADVVDKMGSEQIPALSNAFSDMFMDLINGTLDAKQALTSLAQEVARSGTRILVEFLMSKALQSAFKPNVAAGVGPGGAALTAAEMSQQIALSAPTQTVSGGGQPAWMRIVGGVLSLASSFAGGIGGAASSAWGWAQGLFGAGNNAIQLPASNVDYSWVSTVGHRGGIVGAGMPTVRVHPALFAGAPRMQRGGLAGINLGRLGLGAFEMPAILHRGEMVAPLKSGRLPVTMTGMGSGYARLPGGTNVPLEVQGDNDGWQAAPVIFQRGAITVIAQRGERLDETAGQAVRRAFAEGARQSRRNRR